MHQVKAPSCFWLTLKSIPKRVVSLNQESQTHVGSESVLHNENDSPGAQNEFNISVSVSEAAVGYLSGQNQANKGLETR